MKSDFIIGLIAGWFIGLICGAAYMKVQFKNAFKIWTDTIYNNYRKGIENLKRGKL